MRLEAQSIEKSLVDIMHGQHQRMDEQQGGREMSIISSFKRSQEEHQSKDTNMKRKAATNLEKKLEKIKNAYEDEKVKMLAEHEQHEDDMFIQIQLHLRGKPNKEAREQRLHAELCLQQASQTSNLDQENERMLRVARSSAEREAEILSCAMQTKAARMRSQYDNNIAQLVEEVGIERHWFHLVTARRVEMVKEHNRLVIEEFTRGVEPIGLTQSLAHAIQPLPEPTWLGLDCSAASVASGQTDSDLIATSDSLQQTPIELEAPWPLPLRVPNCSPPSSRSSHHSFVSVREHVDTTEEIDAVLQQATTSLSTPSSRGLRAPRPPTPQPAPSGMERRPRNEAFNVTSKPNEFTRALHAPLHPPTRTATPPTPLQAPQRQRDPTIASRRPIVPIGPAPPAPPPPRAPTAPLAPQAWSFYGPLPPGRPKVARKEKQRDATAGEGLRPEKKVSRWPFRRREELF